MNTSETQVSAHPLKKLLAMLISIAAKGKNIFSVTALVVVAIWAFCELEGWNPSGAVDKIAPAGIVLLMLFEIWKTTTTAQINKKAFLVDLVTGVVEFTLFWVVIAILAMKHRIDFGQLTNWAMLIFVSADAIFVPFNRFVLVFRQITSVSDTSSSTEHERHHAAVSAVASEHHI